MFTMHFSGIRIYFGGFSVKMDAIETRLNFCNTFQVSENFTWNAFFFVILTLFTKFIITEYCQKTPKNFSNELQENFLKKHSSFLSNFHASSSAEVRLLLSQQLETCSTSGTAATHNTPNHVRRRVTARCCCKEGHCFQWAGCKHTIYDLIKCTVCTWFETLHNNWNFQQIVG